MEKARSAQIDGEDQILCLGVGFAVVQAKRIYGYTAERDLSMSAGLQVEGS